MGPDIEAAVKAYAADVRARNFPGKENVYTMKRVG
jgi:3-methyl-2-oxobutanoate hydroxymethyltransferase